MASPGSLSSEQRHEALQRLRTEQLDVLVVGGGVTGVGCALDAAARGLKVALVEQRDLGSGTSSRSSKLIHGGLRYLEQRDFGLVREALRERGILMGTVCPHLTRSVPFLLPLPGRIWSRLYYGAGVFLYDVLAWIGKTNQVPWHRHLSKPAAQRLAPGMKSDALAGAILYYDGQIDDARHTLAVARTAHLHGAAIAASVQLVGLLREHGKVVGAQLHDVESGEMFETRARCVVNATGVWSDDVQAMAEASDVKIRAAKGVHIVVPRDRIDSETALILRTDSSVLLIIPWGSHWLLGTTDTPWSRDRAHPAVSSTDIDYLLAQANQALRRPLVREDVVSVYAGLRPLVDAKAEATTKLSREHVVAQQVPGLVTIAGGKYTTYRVMAADAIDAAVENLQRDVPDSSTDQIQLIGADDWHDWSGRGPELAEKYNLSEPLIERLLRRHGSQIVAVLDIVSEDPRLAEILPGGDYLAAEIVYSARHEGALHLDDVLERRLRIYIETADRGIEAASFAASLLASELRWDTDRIAAEIEAWTGRVAAERAAGLACGDDMAADARASASDGRPLIDVAKQQA